MHALDAAYNNCRNYTRQHAANFYYAFRHLDRDRRRGIHALYAYCQSADNIVDGNESTEVKERQLAAMEAALEQGAPGGGEVLPDWLPVALHDTIARFKLPAEHFASFLEGMRMDLEQREFETFEQLQAYAWRVASVVGLLSIEIFGYQHESVKEYANQLGQALQLTNIIRDVGPDAARRRIFLPLEDLERFGVSREELYDGRSSSAYRELMRFEAERAGRFYQATAGLLQGDDRRTMLPSEIMKNIYYHLLQKISQRNFPLGQQVVRLSKGTKIWIALRTRLLPA